MFNKSSLVIGVTGPTGAGKSTLCEIAKSLGANIIDADKVAKFILDSEKECVARLVESFSPEILTPQGKIDRKILAHKAFANNHATELLNQITHPFITKEIKSLICKYKKDKKKFIIVDTALLFESNLNKECDVTFCVLAPLSVRIKRILKRDNLSHELAVKRVRAQKDNDFYKSKSDIIISGVMPKKELTLFLSDFMEKNK